MPIIAVPARHRGSAGRPVPRAERDDSLARGGGRALARLAHARARVRRHRDQGPDIPAPADGPAAGAGQAAQAACPLQGRDSRVAQPPHQQVVSQRHDVEF